MYPVLCPAIFKIEWGYHENDENNKIITFLFNIYISKDLKHLRAISS